jgi:hypothetical protein
VAGGDLGAIVAATLRRLESSFNGVASVLFRDTEAIARTSRGGADTLQNRADAGLGGIHRSAAGRSDPVADLALNPPDRLGPPLRTGKNPGLLVADELDRMYRAGEKARWANYDTKLLKQDLRGFEHWLRTEGPLAPLTEHYGLNCWEMIGYAAARAGVLDKHRLRDLFQLPRDPDGTWREGDMNSFIERMERKRMPEGSRIYTGEPGGPRPQRGDIVMWNSTGDHVTMATGRTAADGSPELYSFWHAPKHPLTWDEATEYSSVTDAVQVTSVNELTEAMYNMRLKDGELLYDRSIPFEIHYGRGPW